jgi:hypothetical protein
MVAFAICVAPLESTMEWAIKWLTGEDRSYSSVWAATATAAPHVRARAAWAAAWAAAWEATAAAAEGRAFAEAAAAKAARKAARAAMEAARAREGDEERFEARLPKILDRAEAILAGKYPAEEYDAPYEERKER